MRLFVFTFLSVLIFSNVAYTQPNKQDDNLFAAIKEKDVKKFNKAIKKGANINARNSQNYTPLHAIFEYSNYGLGTAENEMFETLIQLGADVNAEIDSKYHNTPLSSAIRVNACKYIEPLIKAGANLKIGRLLHLACFKTSYDCVEILVKNGLDVNAVDDLNETPLIALLTYNDPYNKKIKILEYLHKKGADIFIINKEGKSLVDLCNRWNNIPCANYLMKNGVVARIKPSTSSENNGDKKVRTSFSRNYYGQIYNNGKMAEMSANISVSPNEIKIYNDMGSLLHRCTVIKSKYIKENGIEGIEYYTKHQTGSNMYIYFYEMPNFTYYSNGVQTSITGWNRCVLKIPGESALTLDAQW
jgi:ankyrin repeat protein